MFKTIDPAVIQTYLKTNASKQSIQKAQSINPVLKSVTSNEAIFEYKGSGIRPYHIEIKLNSSNLNVSCSCPYDYGGICKHSVAALKKILLIDKEKKYTEADQFIQSIPSPEIKKKQDKFLKYPAKEGIIDNDLIARNLYSRRGIRYARTIIREISKNFIITEELGWANSKQNFTYDRKSEEITIKCSCSGFKSATICEHLQPAFSMIMDIFGNDYFHDKYLDNKIESYVKEFGLTLDDDYNKFFDFDLRTDGFKALSKFPNIKNTSVAYENPKFSEVSEINFKTKNTQSKEQFGEGLVFEFSEDSFKDLTPIYGKLDKNGAIGTRIKEVDVYDLPGYIQKVSIEFIQIILKADQISSKLNRIYSAEDFYEAVTLFNEILKDAQGLPFYAHELYETYTIKNLTPLYVGEAELSIIFDFSEDNVLYHLKPLLKIGDETFSMDAKELTITPLFIRKGETIYPLKSAKLSADIDYYYNNPQSSYIKKNTIAFKDNILIPLSKSYTIERKKIKKGNSRKVKVSAEGLEKQIYVEDVNGMIKFSPAIQYPEKLIDLKSSELRLSVADNGEFVILDRDADFEEEFRKQIMALHPSFQDENNDFLLSTEELVQDFWFLNTAEELTKQNVKLFGTRDLKSFKYNLNKPSISISVKSDIDWFDIEINVSFGDQKVSLKELQKAFLKRTNFITLGDGTIGILPEDWMAKFSGYFKAGKIDKEHLKISNFQFGIIDELYEILEEKPEFLTQLYEKKRRIQHLENIDQIAVPEGINATLREYQVHGLNWLNFLDQHQLGGCLADDMGLGKTLQMITFLQHLKLIKKPQEASLIIAPTSLIFNWQNEINKFCPTLKLLVFTGTNRDGHIENFSQYDLVITTYGCVMNDIEALKDVYFNYIILDESQAIKNPNSKRYKAVRLLKAYNRVVLTGTPIENNTFDLYAQFNFVNPGLLGNMTTFKKEFSDAIDKEKDVQTSELLAKIISPFMLRRTKEQVAKELPEKVESVLYCEMEKEQRKVYDTFKNQYRDFLLNKIDENGVEKSQMYILEGLTKLRQICNSPATLSDKEEYSHESVKLDILIENITEKTGNHKILVFSSFVKMLELVRTRLDEINIPYEYLDGQTRDRQAKVENFQNKEEIRVFLISMKAGGTGLNLTEADYVFIIDPWWNPAVENQAIDRCYRIGQKKQVMAYRMICRDTIEEKIINLQQKKKKIAHSIISVDEESKSFNAQEVKDLFG